LSAGASPVRQHDASDAGGAVPAPGLSARRAAAHALERMLTKGVALDEALSRSVALADPPLDGRDGRLARSIAFATVRRLGTCRQALGRRMARGLPEGAGRLEPALIAATAQILFLDVPDHAAVTTAVALIQEDRRAARYASLANAVLRRIAREREAILAEAGADPFRDTPAWLAERWQAAHGRDTAESIARAHRTEPGIDLSVKSDPDGWADRLGGIVLPTGSLRLTSRTEIRELAGYETGDWWVQDAAAALPAGLLGVRAGERVADLCAAPGGKTAQLALTGAEVTAVDRSADRLARLQDNLARLGLSATARACDALTFDEGPFDAVLVDAPCSATGTARRHPDTLWLKTQADLDRLAGLQGRLLRHAVGLLKPGGRLVYATCSLEPEEGEDQIERLLAEDGRVAREPLQADKAAARAGFATPAGDLRTLPCHWPNPDPRLAGCDGFFAARLVRRSA
jgi:16S rRNA (cytosine967-C5)-methyltransferase